MLRASASCPTSVAYSLLAALAGTGVPPAVHRLLLMLLVSPRSVRATMSRVLDVVPDLLVTQISTRLMVTPVVMLGSVFMPAS